MKCLCHSLFIGTVSLFFLACEAKEKPGTDTSLGATGDSLALQWAKRVEEQSGGKEVWNNIRYLGFDFFGSRTWYWDKWDQRYRVESEKRNYRMAGHLDESSFHLWLNDSLSTHPDSISKYKDLAYKAWINDTYWLILPFKLRDPGVHLRYLGRSPVDSLGNAIRLELTFREVGVTPQNKYIVYIDSTSSDIMYWEYFRNATDSLPGLSNPWTNYQSFGNIRLSSGRGNRSIDQIAVFEKLPDALFTDIEKSAREILLEE